MLPLPFARFVPAISSSRTSLESGRRPVYASMQESVLLEWSSPIWPRAAIGGPTTCSELPSWARLTCESDGSVSRLLLPTPSAQESTPTEEYAAELREVIDPDDPHHRAYLPGRKWMAQRSLARTAAVLLPTPGANDHTGAEMETRAARDHGAGGGGLALRDLPKLLPTPTVQDGENTAGPSQHERNSEPLNVVATKLLPTPLAGDADGGRTSKGKDRPEEGGLRTTVKLLPTVTASDADAAGNRNLEGSKAHEGISLTDAMTRGASTGRPSDSGSESSVSERQRQLTIEDV